MRKILAITQHTIRNAIRSKVVVSLLVVLILVMVGLPLALHSDGTLRGRFRLFFNIHWVPLVFFWP